VNAVTHSATTLLPFLAKLEGHAPLTSSDREAILNLPHTVRTVNAGAYLFREGDRATDCCVILSGFACRHKILPDGARQILSVHMKGDGVDLQNALMALADHNIQTVTAAQVAFIPASAVSDLIAAHPGAARAMWIETLTDASIQREWTVNVGRRSAATRIAHLLCELGFRMEQAGEGERHHYELPLTQEQLADATGLTAVHVNRVVQTLRSEGLIGREKRSVTIADWDALADAGGFSMTYLQPMKMAA
jgi:CRP-like cAMP-binding protein